MDYYRQHARHAAQAATHAHIEYQLDEALCRLHAMALIPPIGEIRMAGFKRYYRDCRRVAWAYARAAKKLAKRGAPREEWEDLALEAMNRYAVIGRRHNDNWLPTFVDDELRVYSER
jgi:hypothetical protein